MPKITAIHVTLHGEKNFPFKASRLTPEQVNSDLLGDLNELVTEARKQNPDIGMDGLLQGILRVGIAAVVKQIAKGGKLDAFLKTVRK